MWTIDKEFAWEGGHRVWAQDLKYPHLSISTECSCKHLHGHSYSLKVFVSSSVLDPSGMVVDFKNLNFVKDFVDNILDHKFLLDINDPNFDIITAVSTMPPHEDHVNFTNLADVCPTDDQRRSLHRRSFVLVDFVPTSENICKHLKTHFQDILGDVATISAVELWETKKSHCRFE